MISLLGIEYMKKKWKQILSIGRHNGLHYLEVQRNALINAILALSLIMSVLYTLGNLMLGLINFLALLIVPFCLFIFWLNHKRHYKLARNVAFFSFLVVVLAWSLHTRRGGAHFLNIPLSCFAAALYRERKNVIFAMLGCSLSFLIYTLVDTNLPFVPRPELNYFVVRMILIYITAGVVFFQIILYVDITKHFSTSLDRKLKELQRTHLNQKSIEQKLQISNEELSGFNKRLKILARQSNEELYAYQQAINDNLFLLVTDLDGIILKTNKPFALATKYSKKELKNIPITILSPNDAHQNLFQNIKSVLDSNQIWRGEVKNKCKDGSCFWMLSSILPLFDDQNKVIKLFIISADITAKKRAEEKENLALNQLTDHEKRLRLLLENQSDMVAISEKKGEKKFVNQSFCDFFGRDRNYYLGTDYRVLDPENINKSYPAVLNSLSYDNPKIQTLHLLKNTHGQNRWIEWNEVALFDENKEITEVLSFGHDITELKEIDFENANYIAQFEELAFKNAHKFRAPLNNLIQIITAYDLRMSSKEEIIKTNTLIKIILDELDGASHELSNFISVYHTKSKNVQENGAFNLDFHLAKNKHLNWKYKIKNFFEGSSSLTYNQAVSEEFSELGKWFYNEGKAKYGQLPAMQEFELLLKKMHKMVAEIIILKSSGNKKKADQKYKKLQKVSDKIILVLDESGRIIS